MITLDELRKDAIENSTYRIEWEKLDSDPSARADFERIVPSGLVEKEALEKIYNMLSTNDTALPFDQIEHYIDKVTNALQECYILEHIWNTYTAVRDITSTP